MRGNINGEDGLLSVCSCHLPYLTDQIKENDKGAEKSKIANRHANLHYLTKISVLSFGRNAFCHKEDGHERDLRR
jgi:hypothetical protein